MVHGHRLVRIGSRGGHDEGVGPNLDLGAGDRAGVGLQWRRHQACDGDGPLAYGGAVLSMSTPVKEGIDSYSFGAIDVCVLDGDPVVLSGVAPKPEPRRS